MTHVQELQARLEDPSIAQALHRILDRLDSLEKGVEQLSHASAVGPGMVSMAVDTLDEQYQRAALRGIQIEERLSNALALAEKLTSPEMVDKLNAFFAFTEQVPGLISMFTDSLDDVIRRSAQRGIDIEKRFQTALSLAEKLTSSEMEMKISQVVEFSNQAPGIIAMLVDTVDEEMKKTPGNGVDLKTLLTLSQQIGLAAAKAQNADPAKVSGLFGLLKALRDPDRQLALGFIMNFAKAYGEELSKK